MNEKTVGQLIEKFINSVNWNTDIKFDAIKQAIVVLRVIGKITETTFQKVRTLCDHDLIYWDTMHTVNGTVNVYMPHDKEIEKKRRNYHRGELFNPIELAGQIILLLTEDNTIKKLLNDITLGIVEYEKMLPAYDYIAEIEIPSYLCNNMDVIMDRFISCDCNCWQYGDYLYYCFPHSLLIEPFELYRKKICEIPPNWDPQADDSEMISQMEGGKICAFSDSIGVYSISKSYIFYNLYKSKIDIFSRESMPPLDIAGQQENDLNVFSFEGKYILATIDNDIRFVCNQSPWEEYFVISPFYLVEGHSRFTPVDTEAMPRRIKVPGRYSLDESVEISSKDIIEIMRRGMITQQWTYIGGKTIEQTIEEYQRKKLLPAYLSCDNLVEFAKKAYKNRLISLKEKASVRNLINLLHDSHKEDADVTLMVYDAFWLARTEIQSLNDINLDVGRALLTRRFQMRLNRINKQIGGGVLQKMQLHRSIVFPLPNIIDISILENKETCQSKKIGYFKVENGNTITIITDARNSLNTKTLELEPGRKTEYEEKGYGSISYNIDLNMYVFRYKRELSCYEESQLYETVGVNVRRSILLIDKNGEGTDK